MRKTRNAAEATGRRVKPCLHPREPRVVLSFGQRDQVRDVVVTELFAEPERTGFRCHIGIERQRGRYKSIMMPALKLELQEMEPCVLPVT